MASITVDQVLSITNAVLPSLMTWIHARTREDGQPPTLDQAKEWVAKSAKDVVADIDGWKASHPRVAQALVSAPTSTSTGKP